MKYAQSEAMALIMTEWTSSRDYNTRVANLHGTGSRQSYADGRNGDLFLNPTGSAAIRHVRRDEVLHSCDATKFFTQMYPIFPSASITGARRQGLAGYFSMAFSLSSMPKPGAVGISR